MEVPCVAHVMNYWKLHHLLWKHLKNGRGRDYYSIQCTTQVFKSIGKYKYTLE